MCIHADSGIIRRQHVSESKHFLFPQAVNDETDLVTAMILTEIRRLASGGREDHHFKQTPPPLTETLDRIDF